MSIDGRAERRANRGSTACERAGRAWTEMERAAAASGLAAGCCARLGLVGEAYEHARAAARAAFCTAAGPWLSGERASRMFGASRAFDEQPAQTSVSPQEARADRIAGLSRVFPELTLEALEALDAERQEARQSAAGPGRWRPMGADVGRNTVREVIRGGGEDEQSPAAVCVARLSAAADDATELAAGLGLDCVEACVRHERAWWGGELASVCVAHEESAYRAARLAVRCAVEAERLRALADAVAAAPPSDGFCVVCGERPASEHGRCSSCWFQRGR